VLEDAVSKDVLRADRFGRHSLGRPSTRCERYEGVIHDAGRDTKTTEIEVSADLLTKRLTNLIKMVAYQAEGDLVRTVGRYYPG
jgi:hypothetical protein